MPTVKTKNKQRVSKDRWLAKALDMLESSGIENVKIERLARMLGVARSGFYWHFKNRQDLLEHMLEFWIHKYTGIVSDNPDVQKLDPEKRLLTTMNMIRDQQLAKYDLPINAWAKVDPMARKALKKAMKIRFDFIGSMFADLGFTGDELEMRTRLFVCYHSWESTMFSDVYLQKNLLKLLYELLICK